MDIEQLYETDINSDFQKLEKLKLEPLSSINFSTVFSTIENIDKNLYEMDKNEIQSNRKAIVTKKIQDFRKDVNKLRNIFNKRKQEQNFDQQKNELFGRQDDGQTQTHDKKHYYNHALKKLHEAQNYTQSIAMELDRNSNTMKKTQHNVYQKDIKYYKRIRIFIIFIRFN